MLPGVFGLGKAPTNVGAPKRGSGDGIFACCQPTGVVVDLHPVAAGRKDRRQLDFKPWRYPPSALSGLTAIGHSPASPVSLVVNALPLG